MIRQTPVCLEYGISHAGHPGTNSARQIGGTSSTTLGPGAQSDWVTLGTAPREYSYWRPTLNVAYTSARQTLSPKFHRYAARRCKIICRSCQGIRGPGEPSEFDRVYILSSLQ
jgi:hypothetical protein